MIDFIEKNRDKFDKSDDKPAPQEEQKKDEQVKDEL